MWVKGKENGSVVFLVWALSYQSSLAYRNLPSLRSRSLSQLWLKGRLKSHGQDLERSHRTCFLRKPDLKKIQFHLSFQKYRQDWGKIKKNINSRQKAGSGSRWLAAGRAVQECLLKDTPEHSQHGWGLSLQLPLSLQSCCPLKRPAWNLLQIGKMRDQPFLFAAFLFHAFTDLCPPSASSLLFQDPAEHPHVKSVSLPQVLPSMHAVCVYVKGGAW